VPLALRLAARIETAPETIGDVLRRAAASAPHAVALIDGVPDPAARRRWTYAQLLARAEALARGLAERLRPGERLAVALPTQPESLLCSYAAALAGLALVPVNPLLRPAELAHVLGQSRAAGLVFADEYRGYDLRGALDSVRGELGALRERIPLAGLDTLAQSADPRLPLPSVSPGDLAQIVYTSGTTGAPKGACLTHGGMTQVSRAAARRFGITKGDVHVVPLPLFHVGGQVTALELAQYSGTYALVRAFDAALVLELIESERAAFTVAVPTMLAALLAEARLARRDLSSLRTVSSGAAVVPAELVRRVRDELGAGVTIVFGQTECSGFVSQTYLDDAPEIIESTLGSPLDGVDVRVVDPATGEIVETGVRGELEVRGPNVMSGYHQCPEASADAFRDGWLRTGDLVTLDDAGHLRITGRLKDVIISGGVNVYAAEVEAAITAHPGIAQAAVFGVPDERWGERVVAAIRYSAPPADGPAALDALCADLAARLAPYKRPKQWVVVDTMPVTPYGKIQKFRLREQLVSA